MSALDTYLAWQAEMGGDEVILEAPLVRKADAQSIPSAKDTPTRPGPQREPLHSSPEKSTPTETGPAFFTAIAEKLAKPDSSSRRARVAETPAPAPSASPALPEFAGPEAFWQWLDAESPQWFTGSGAPARGLGHTKPRLAVVEFAATGDGIFTGESGALLDKMMQAIGLPREALYLTALMKTPPTGRAWARKDAARMVPVLLAELRVMQCGLVLLMGEGCVQAVLRTGRGLDALAGAAHEIADAPGLAFAATWHPLDLMADESRKKPAWAHLKWLQARLPRAAA